MKNQPLFLRGGEEDEEVTTGPGGELGREINLNSYFLQLTVLLVLWSPCDEGCSQTGGEVLQEEGCSQIHTFPVPVVVWPQSK